MPSTVLLAARPPARLVRLLSERYRVLGPFEGLSAEALPEDVREVQALVTMGTLRTGRALIEALPALGLVCCFGTGYEGVDLAAARERGVVVTHSPGANASSVADYAIALVLASTRRVLDADRFVREGRWQGNAVERMPAVPGLTGARFGIYGLGAVGTRIATRAAAFETQVGYHSRSRRPDLPYAYFDTLFDLARWADILVVAVRADAANRHAVNREVLEALGPQGHLVNIARGSVVDEAALIEALDAGTVAGAGLDVYEHEPAVPDGLKRSPRAVLGPHVAAATVTALEAQEDMVLANLDAFFSGRPVPNPVPDV